MPGNKIWIIEGVIYKWSYSVASKFTKNYKSIFSGFMLLAHRPECWRLDANRQRV